MDRDTEAADLTDIIRAAQCDRWQSQRMSDLGARVVGIPWGTASGASDEDSWDILAFLEQVSGSADGLVAKSMIVADHSHSPRWEILGMQLVLQAPTFGTFLPEEGLRMVTDKMESLASEGMAREYMQMHSGSSKVRPWNRRKQLRGLSELRDVAGMTYTCVAGMAIWSLVRDEMLGVRKNPFDALFRVFERGLLVDWNTWRFTNLRGEHLGTLPEALL